MNVGDTLRDRRLACAVSDMGFHEFRRQLDYKSRMRGNDLAVRAYVLDADDLARSTSSSKYLR